MSGRILHDVRADPPGNHAGTTDILRHQRTYPQRQITGIYTDEGSSILINDEPVKSDEQEITQTLKIIHDIEDGGLDVVDVQEKTDEEKVIGAFSTESFSNWLLYLDEDLEEITINQGDSITLRPYSEWIWDQQNTVNGQTVRWKTVNTNGIMNVTPNDYTDDQLNQTYTRPEELHPVQER